MWEDKKRKRGSDAGISTIELPAEHVEEQNNWKHREEEEIFDNVYITLKQWAGRK